MKLTLFCLFINFFFLEIVWLTVFREVAPVSLNNDMLQTLQSEEEINPVNLKIIFFFHEDELVTTSVNIFL